jgi:cytidylate kinase
MTKSTTIAIDGPAACGKTTIGRLLAKKLGYRFVDTGAWYRALTWEALRVGVDVEDEAALGKLAAGTKIEPAPDTDEGIIVNSRYINVELRTPEVDFGVSPVAKVAAVRKVMVREQQRIAKGGRAQNLSRCFRGGAGAAALSRDNR